MDVFVKGGIQGLILGPTRELALQTSSVVKELVKRMNVQCMVSMGGTSLREDIMRLYNEMHIVVAVRTTTSWASCTLRLWRARGQHCRHQCFTPTCQTSPMQDSWAASLRRPET